MNWLVLVILAVMAVSVFVGYKTGFMKVVLSLVSWVIVLIACYVATPVVADIIIEVTPLEEVLESTINEELNQALDGIVEGVIETEALAELEAKLPEQIKDAILGEHASLAEMITSTGDIEIDAGKLAGIAASLIALIVVLVATKIGLFVVSTVMDVAAKLPLIGQANTLLGIAAGAVQGLIWCWVVIAVVAMLAFTGTNTELMLLVNDSQILTWLYENNPIMGVIAKFF